MSGRAAEQALDGLDSVESPKRPSGSDKDVDLRPAPAEQPAQRYDRAEIEARRPRPNSGMSANPNPGSDEAINAGCRCPVLDNAHGHGYLGGRDEKGEIVFVMNEGCPLHWPPDHDQVAA